MNQLTSSSELVSKVTFAYDEGDFSDSGLSQNISPVQHDTTNIGASYVAGRGNLTSTKRWDVTQPTNGAAAITTATLKYNTAGSVVAKITPWDGTNRPDGVRLSLRSAGGTRDACGPVEERAWVPVGVSTIGIYGNCGGGNGRV